MHAGDSYRCYLKEVGKRIRHTRESLNWTQETLAEESHLDRSYIGGVERGEHNLSFTTLCRITDALGKKVSEITLNIPERKHD